MPRVSHGTAKSSRHPTCLTVCLSSGHVTHIWHPKRPFPKRSLYFLLRKLESNKVSICTTVYKVRNILRVFGKPNIIDLLCFEYFLDLPVYCRYLSDITTKSLDLQVNALCDWNSCAKKADMRTEVEVSLVGPYLILEAALP